MNLLLLYRIKCLPKNTNGRLAIPALAGLLVFVDTVYKLLCRPMLVLCLQLRHNVFTMSHCQHGPVCRAGESISVPTWTRSHGGRVYCIHVPTKALNDRSLALYFLPIIIYTSLFISSKATHFVLSGNGLIFLFIKILLLHNCLVLIYLSMPCCVRIIV